MKSIKSFGRYVRQEINRISLTIKQMEFRVMRLPAFLRRKLREDMQELRRMKAAILHRVSQLTDEARLQESTMQSIRDEISILHKRCRELKTKHL